MTITRCFMLLSAIFFITQIPIFAESTDAVEEGLREISTSILSPYCPGRLLADCPSASATELKEEIRTRLSAGETQQAITDSLYKRYGEEVRSTPSMENFGLFAWLGPLIFFFMGMAAFFLFLRRSAQRGSGQSK